MVSPGTPRTTPRGRADAHGGAQRRPPGLRRGAAAIGVARRRASQRRRLAAGPREVGRRRRSRGPCPAPRRCGAAPSRARGRPGGLLHPGADPAAGDTGGGPPSALPTSASRRSIRVRRPEPTRAATAPRASGFPLRAVHLGRRRPERGGGEGMPQRRPAPSRPAHQRARQCRGQRAGGGAPRFAAAGNAIRGRRPCRSRSATPVRRARRGPFAADRPGRRPAAAPAAPAARVRPAGRRPSRHRGRLPRGSARRRRPADGGPGGAHGPSAHPHGPERTVSSTPSRRPPCGGCASAAPGRRLWSRRAGTPHRIRARPPVRPHREQSESRPRLGAGRHRPPQRALVRRRVRLHAHLRRRGHRLDRAAGAAEARRLRGGERAGKHAQDVARPDGAPPYRQRRRVREPLRPAAGGAQQRRALARTAALPDRPSSRRGAQRATGGQCGGPAGSP